MKIWLIMSGEPLALYGERPHRVGILSDMLANKGHYVTWWTTTFDHQNKKYFYNENKSVEVSDNLKMYFLHSNVEYKKNISFDRIFNHKQVSKSFISVAEELDKPDLIFCAFPTIDLAYEATIFGKDNNIPVIIDVRDLWPDIFLDPLPKMLKPIGKILLNSYINKTKYIFDNSSAITAVSDKYLEWAIDYSKRCRNSNDQVFPLGYKIDLDDNLDFEVSKLKFKQLGLNESKTLIWFVGTFGHTYNLSTVIKAARALKGRDDIQFVFTGDGEKMDEWSKLAQGLDNIIFTGWVDKVGLSYLSKVSDIGLMSYKKGAPQGLPNKIFEYMSSGLPIVSSLQTETKDLLLTEDIGLTYIADDVDDFIYNLKLLIDNKDKLKGMGDRAKLVFYDKYSSAIIYENMINYFEKKF